MTSVFWRFFALGLFSFGGPAAHIGYFQREFVIKRKWLSDTDFSQAVALCQFLPGPASSQLGMYIGYSKAGYFGALAAFIGFTFPSFLLLTLVAIANQQLGNVSYIETMISAAKLLAVVVVADALWGMAKKNINDVVTFVVCLVTAIWAYASSGLLAQIVPILVAALLGFTISSVKERRNTASVNTLNAKKPEPIKPNGRLLICFSILLFSLPLVASYSELLALFNVFYQAGSFVFGGGHVVLPLLEPMLEGLVEPDTFITAYASAQLVPGPMFTMASFLGASVVPQMPFLGSLAATIAVFLPGGLLLFAFLPAWKALFSHPKLKLAVILVNASVVGLLASAFYQPVIMSSIYGLSDIVAVLLGFIMLKFYKCPVWLLAALFACYSFIV